MNALEEELEEARRQVLYYEGVAMTAGARRLRDVAELSSLVGRLRAAEGELAARHRELLAIFDGIEEAVYVADPETHELLYANEAVQRGLESASCLPADGRSESASGLPTHGRSGDMIGKACHAVLHGRDTPCPSCTNHLIFGENQGNVHVREVHDEDVRRWYRCIERAIRWPTGKRVRCVLAFDITQQRHLEQERVLRQKMESVGRLAGGIAHDFNNLLAVIMGNVSLLEAADPGETEQICADMLAACREARSLSTQLLTFASGGAPVKKAASLARLVTETVGFALRGSNVVARTHFPDDLWSVEVDPGQMSHVVHNLVVNAAESMPAGGGVEIHAENVPPMTAGECPRVHLRLHDQGPGIPEENQLKIFEPYFTTKRAGRGLGLATVYSIVRQHGGHIEVESAPGRGATFHLRLPAVVPVERPEPTVAAPAHQAGGRILLMDDNDGVRRGVCRLLRELGYTCVDVADGRLAIDAYEAARRAGEPFAAVILDLTVPGGMGGLETLRHLQSADPEVRAIVSSGYSEDDAMSNHRAHGFAGVLAKPFDLRQLALALEGVIGSRRPVASAPPERPRP